MRLKSRSIGFGVLVEDVLVLLAVVMAVRVSVRLLRGCLGTRRRSGLRNQNSGRKKRLRRGMSLEYGCVESELVHTFHFYELEGLGIVFRFWIWIVRYYCREFDGLWFGLASTRSYS